MSRELARAKRCQLLIGSICLDQCPCLNSDGCQLSIEEREKYRNHPEVLKVRKEHWEKWYQRKTDGSSQQE